MRGKSARIEALGVTIDAVNHARTVEGQFNAAWTRSRSSCSTARINFQEGVDGTTKAKCMKLRGEERTDCIDTLYDALWDTRLGTAMDVACGRESTDRGLWDAAHATTGRMEATEDQIRTDIDQTQQMIANLSVAIRKSRQALKTCQP
ncbi:MAG: hypothetical protein ABI459_11530 [Deltaproteobacteria bacterium]